MALNLLYPDKSEHDVEPDPIEGKRLMQVHDHPGDDSMQITVWYEAKKRQGGFYWKETHRVFHPRRAS